MKNNKILFAVVVILLNILVVYMVGQSFLGKTSQYDQTLSEARNYSESQLYSKAIDKYNEAVAMKDSLDLRLEIIDTYKKGLDSGEFVETYNIFVDIETVVSAYSKEAAVYEKACEIFIAYDQYEKCANVLMQAENSKVSSEKLDEYLGKVRYQYTKVYGMYTSVLPEFDGMYTVTAEGAYTFLNNEGSPELDGGYTQASSFSEGYAFVKSSDAEGNDISYIINKDGQRQAYLTGVEASSGVGKAKNKDGEDVLLLAGKTGEKYKYYDIEGKEVFGEYQFAGRFRNNVAAVMESEGKWKLIDGAGNPIIDKVFADVVLNEFDECAPKGLIIAKEKDTYHIYKYTGEQVGDFACDGAKAFVDEYAAFKKGDLWGFVDSTGKVIIEPQYEDAKSFSNKMGAVKINEGWSFINPKNEIVIQETFEEVDYLNSKGICFVKFDGYWSYLKMYYSGN